jgi:hypothetical protein
MQNKEMKESIDSFLDAFMEIEYKGHDHAVAREHYRAVFNDLVPKYFSPGETGRRKRSQSSNTDQ